MNEYNPVVRSPELMNRADTGLLVIDVQEKLLPRIFGHEKIVWNCRRLLEGAKALGMSVSATEQYPAGLGPTTKQLSGLLGEIPEKLDFSSLECRQITESWSKGEIEKVLLCGIETHVCVQQTALDLMAAGFRVYLAVDAVGARNSLDHEVALRRLDSAGATITTTEAALFEWCQRAGTEEFKKISRLVKESLAE